MLQDRSQEEKLFSGIGQAHLPTKFKPAMAVGTDEKYFSLPGIIGNLE